MAGATLEARYFVRELPGQKWAEFEVRLAPGPRSIGDTGDGSYATLYGYIWAVAIEDGQARIYQVVDENYNPVPLAPGRPPVSANTNIQVATLLYTPNVTGAYSASAYTPNVSSALDASQYTANVSVDESEAQYDDNVGASLSTQGYTPNVIVEERR